MKSRGEGGEKVGAASDVWGLGQDPSSELLAETSPVSLSCSE